jgi:hypothetical protein
MPRAKRLFQFPLPRWERARVRGHGRFFTLTPAPSPIKGEGVMKESSKEDGPEAGTSGPLRRSESLG